MDEKQKLLPMEDPVRELGITFQTKHVNFIHSDANVAVSLKTLKCHC
jgi:hypothetical protein